MEKKTQKIEYTFTGFLPSGDICDWYYDENKRTAFATSITVSEWSQKPKQGDKITFEKSGYYGEVTEKVFINNVLVYPTTP